MVYVPDEQQRQPKEPSAGSQLAKQLGTILATSAVQQGGQYLGEKVISGLGGLFSGGGATTAGQGVGASLGGATTGTAIAGGAAAAGAGALGTSPASLAGAYNLGGVGSQVGNISQGYTLGANTTNTGGLLSNAGKYVMPAASALGVGAGAYGLHEGYQSGVMGHQNRDLKSGVSNTLAAGGLGAGLAGLGVAMGPVGWAALAGLAAYNTFARAGKHGDQKSRDVSRKHLQNVGLVSKDWKITNPDGTVFDIGKDGGGREEYGINKNKDSTEYGKYLRNFELNHMDDAPLQSDVVDRLGALTSALFDSKKERDDFTGYLTRAALQSETPEGVASNVQHYFKQAAGGLTNQELKRRIEARVGDEGGLDRATADRYKGYIDLYHDNNEISINDVRDGASYERYMRQLMQKNSDAGGW